MKPTLPDPEILINRLAEEIGPVITPDCAFVGIRTGGVWLRDTLVERLGLHPLMGELDVSFYRDDFEKSGLHAEVQPTRIPFEVDGRHILIFDDVLYTGRTIRAAINLIFDYGRPASIRLAVLVDRGGRELPICADFVGATVKADATEEIILARDADNGFSLTCQGRGK